MDIAAWVWSVEHPEGWRHFDKPICTIPIVNCHLQKCECKKSGGFNVSESSPWVFLWQYIHALQPLLVIHAQVLEASHIRLLPHVIWHRPPLLLHKYNTILTNICLPHKSITCVNMIIRNWKRHPHISTGALYAWPQMHIFNPYLQICCYTVTSL